MVIVFYVIFIIINLEAVENDMAGIPKRHGGTRNGTTKMVVPIAGAVGGRVGRESGIWHGGFA